MTIQLAYQDLAAKLCDIYEHREAANIADMIIEHVTGQRKIDRITFKGFSINPEQQKLLAKYTNELLTHKPIQYVLGEAWFMGMKLRVNENVLIPRPETEELVDWIIKDIQLEEPKSLSLLDIGTGSGCIPISVKKNVPDISVFAVDISEEALQLASINAIEQHVLIDFLRLDFLDEKEWVQARKYDIIVSNPPYIQQGEEATMNKNVLDYEPHIALFVPDEDALLFYKAIAKFGIHHLNENGTVYVEINEASGDLVVQLFRENGYTEIELKKDMQGKDRMVKAKKPSAIQYI